MLARRKDPSAIVRIATTDLPDVLGSARTLSLIADRKMDEAERLSGLERERLLDEATALYEESSRLARFVIRVGESARDLTP